MKIGLALGGGGARGFAHIGAVARLAELGIHPHCIAGTSIGAIVGGICAAGTMERAFEWCRAPDWKKLPGILLDAHFSGKALISGDRIEKLLRELIPARTFGELHLPFAAVATDLVSGERVVMHDGDLMSAIRASMSIPGVFSPVMREGRILVDGGLVDPLPVAACRELGADFVIAIDINPPGDDTGRKPFAKLNIFDVIIGTIRIFNCTMTRHALASDGAPEILLRPAVGNILTLDFRHAERIVEIGRRAVDDARGSLQSLLQNLNASK